MNDSLTTDFETILLKHLIEDKVFFNKAKTILKKSIFSNIANGTIYEIIEKYYNEYKITPQITEIILKARELPNPELKKQIAETLGKIPKSQSINKQFLDDYTLNYVKNQLFEQGLMEGADFIDKKSEKAKIKAKELIDESQKLTLVADLGDKYSEFKDRFEYYQNPEKGFKYFRFDEMNKYLGEGILPGTLNLFLAPPGIGKSLMISYTIGDCLLQKKNVLLVSMEMSNYEFMRRIDADLLDVCIYDLKNKDFEIEIREKFQKLRSNIGELYVQNFPPNAFSAYTLESLLDMYKSNDIRIDMVFLDYLGLMKSDLVSPSVGLYTHIKSIGEEVRAVAKLWNIPVFSASQLNRSSVNKDSKDVDNSMIADSLGSAMTADFLCMLAQTEKQKEVGQITFKITKNRYTGMTREFVMDVDYKKMRFGQVKSVDNKILETTKIKELTSETVDVPWVKEDSGVATKVENSKNSELGKVEKPVISDETQAMFDKLLEDLDA